jgi:hypothetical protein
MIAVIQCAASKRDQEGEVTTLQDEVTGCTNHTPALMARLAM